MPLKCPGSASVATRMPFESVVIWSRSVGSLSEGCLDVVAYFCIRPTTLAGFVAPREMRDDSESALLTVGVRNMVVLCG